MGDQVAVVDVELPEGVVMRVPERQVTFRDGTSVFLRRFWHGEDGRRVYLADGRWLAQLGGDIPHLYAAPSNGIGEATVYGWRYRSPATYATWEDALSAATGAIEADRLVCR